MAQRGSQGLDDDRTEGGEIDLRALGRGIWRRRLAILIPTAIAAAGAVLFVTMSSPYYRSGAMVLIENREVATPRVPNERELLPDEQAVASQVQLLQSRDLARSVVKALDLGSVPEFAENDSGLIDGLVAALGLGHADSMSQSEKVVDRVAKNLTVFPVTGSRVVGVEFVSKSADTAARVVNGFVDAYLAIQLDAKRSTNRQASQYLSDEIKSLRTRVGEAEDRVEQFRAKAGLLVGTNNMTVAAQQLGDTSNQLSTSRTQQADAQAKADMIRTVLKQGRPSEALEIANSELVRNLAQQRSQLAAQIASEGRTLLPQHPRMRELSAQLTGLDGQIRSEAEKLARAFENDAKTAGARVAALQKQLDGMKGVAASANGQEVQLRALEREARSQRDLLEQMLNRYREATARDNPEGLLADARIISRGAAATEPYFPKKLPTIMLVTLAAFVLSLFAAAAAEVFGSSAAARPVETGRATPPPAVGETSIFGRLRGQASAARTQPDVAAVMASSAAPASSAKPLQPVAVRPVTEPAPQAADPALKASPPKGTPKSTAGKAAAARTTPLAPVSTIESADATLVASLARQLAAVPTSDGALKILTTGVSRGLDVSAVSSMIAATISESGRRVVQVEAASSVDPEDDFEGPGLSELLLGDATFAQAIHRDPGSRVHIVPQGDYEFESLDAAAKSRLGVVLEALALTYDFVLVTAPSGPGGADDFAGHCAAAVLVSNTSAAEPATVAAHERLKQTGIDDVVVLLVSDGGDRPRGDSLAA